MYFPDTILYIKVTEMYYLFQLKLQKLKAQTFISLSWNCVLNRDILFSNFLATLTLKQSSVILVQFFPVLFYHFSWNLLERLKFFRFQLHKMLPHKFYSFLVVWGSIHNYKKYLSLLLSLKIDGFCMPLSFQISSTK